MSGEVLKSIGLDGMSSLYQMVDPEYYPFSKSPELNVFFEEYKKKLINLILNLKIMLQM